MFRDRSSIFLDEDFDNIQTPEPIKGSPTAITSIFGWPSLDLDKLEEYEEQNQVQLNILKIIKRTENRKTVTRACKHNSTPGCQNNGNPKIDVAVDTWPSNELYWLPCSSLIDNQIVCSKTSCQFAFETPGAVERHEHNCKEEQKVTAKQKFYGSGENKMHEIIAAGYLPESFKNFRNPTKATFDIEVCQIGETLKTISIAVASTLHDDQYFERESSNPEHYQKLVDKFMHYLMDLQKKIQLPLEMENALEKMGEETKEMKQSPEKSRIEGYASYLRTYKQLHVFGFNSSRFDLPVLIGGIVQFASKIDLEPEVLKKGSQYITLTVGDIIFKDTLKYTSPCSLAKFLLQWRAPDAKGIFPHGHFPSIEAIRECVVFPPQETFYSKLKQCGVSDEEYSEAKLMFDTKMENGEWKNFSDYLKWYNVQDVGPLVVALTNCFDKFYECFQIDAMTRLSLPSIAFEAMFGLFDKSLPYVATFTKKSEHIRKLFRSKVDGGVSNIYHRDIDLMGDDSPYNARFAPNGDPFSSVFFIDCNSMYLWGEDQILPLTPGVEWKLKGKRFEKVHMSSQCSLKAMQWLYSEQESERCRDKNGNKIQMEHAYFQGEKIIFNEKVDGYAFFDDRHHVWEFNGCYWHGCEQCYPDWLKKASLAEIERKANWYLKMAKLEDNNCIIHVMIEHDYTPDESIQTQMPRILLKDTQETLLEAIRTGEVFGFVTCSVRTPEHLIQKFQDSSFLFPPVIQKTEITEDLIGPFMKAKMMEQERKAGRRTLIQTYHGDNLLLMTPLVQFYLENGMEIHNITSFIQYIPGRGLAPFVEKVVSMRVAATYEKDDAKQLTAKLFGNSGYGKCAEDVEKHSNTCLIPAGKDISQWLKRVLYKDHCVIDNEEGEAGAFEITCDKSNIEDSKPVHIGVCILQWSKLIFLKLMFYLFNHLEPGSFRSVYADTDSMCLALTKSRPVENDTEEEKYRALFDPIVRPDMRDSWESTWKDWICTTTEVEDIRTPGKFKCEFLFRRGRFCALSPKTYFAYDKDADDKKTGYKGICHAEARKLGLNTYLECLYGSTSKEVENRGFKLNQNKQLVYYEQLKRGLNDIFCKFQVQNDHITCKPLSKDGKLL